MSILYVAGCATACVAAARLFTRHENERLKARVHELEKLLQQASAAMRPFAKVADPINGRSEWSQRRFNDNKGKLTDGQFIFLARTHADIAAMRGERP